MRLLGTITDESKAREFSYFLLREGIDNHIEPQGTADSGPLEHLVWVHDEDQMTQALHWMEAFTQDPDNPMFYGHYQFVKHLRPDAPSQAKAPPTETLKIQAPPRRMPRRPPTGPITFTVLLVCALLYGLMAFAPKPAPNDLKGHYESLPSRIFFTLHFDFSTRDMLFQKLYRTYPPQQLLKPETLPVAGQKLYQQALDTPEWTGIYPYLVSWFSSTPVPKPEPAPLFERAREGQLWRLFSPVIMHGNFMHIFFNMLWLIILGPIIEARLGWMRYGMLILAAGILSNTGQYLMSGPDFVGYSGVITGMAGFIWMRQKKAPWESYMVHPSTFKFLGFIVILMVGLQLFSFFSQVWFGKAIKVGIANTAHVVGGLVGIYLARFSWFSSH